jgi:pyruvate/2-oxoglutarate dehydrogenase complex dihydrolipoamide acyltransferase (E2) component
LAFARRACTIAAVATEVKLDRILEGVESATVTSWLKSEGDRVEQGEPPCEVETDKITCEVEAEVSGTLVKILVAEGEASVGQTIALIEEPDTQLRIFVSYRRDDEAAGAGRLHDRLANRFGTEHVFFDVDTIEPGLDFREVINAAVGRCDVLIAVIGQRWLALDPEGESRLRHKNDLVRLEIEAALARDVRVIPVLVEDASMPGPDALPRTIAELSYRNAHTVRHTSFHADVTRLIDVLERLERRKAEDA